MAYIKSIFIVGIVLYGLASWVNWVSENDEHLFKIMDCLSEHKDVSRQEAVYLCELEVR